MRFSKINILNYKYHSKEIKLLLCIYVASTDFSAQGKAASD